MRPARLGDPNDTGETHTVCEGTNKTRLTWVSRQKEKATVIFRLAERPHTTRKSTGYGGAKTKPLRD